jgi:hypothetical protein
MSNVFFLSIWAVSPPPRELVMPARKEERTQGTIAVLVVWLCHACLGLPVNLSWLGAFTYIAGTSYIGETVCSRLLGQHERPPWVATMGLLRLRR